MRRRPCNWYEYCNANRNDTMPPNISFTSPHVLPWTTFTGSAVHSVTESSDCSQILSRLLVLSKYHLTSLHGDLPPRIRESALSQFTSHPSSHFLPGVLLCTDVAARGVDFTDIDMVIQYDTPTDPKTFTHRAGRTARAGKLGRAVVLLGKGREEDYVGR